MDLSISGVVFRLACPSFSPFQIDALEGEEEGEASPPQLQGIVLHAVVESYLKNEPIAAAVNLLRTLSGDAAFVSEVERRACNLISFASQLTVGAEEVRPEASIHLALENPDNGDSVMLHGRCDCLVVRRSQVIVVDWKPAPRADRLDELQLMFYLYATLVERDMRRGEWLLYFYEHGGSRRGVATRDELRNRLVQAVVQSLGGEGSLHPGGHCTSCLYRKECTASAYFVG